MTDLYIGLISGTSMDCIDATLVDLSDQQPKLLHAIGFDLPPGYKETYLKIINETKVELEELGQLDVWTGELLAEATNALLKEAGIAPNQVKAIGSHGQTIWHAPDVPRAFTMQLGNPNVIAHRTGITTVADLRGADMAAGGQGAPLAPLFHKYVFANPNEPRCIVNIGGLSNISIIDGNTFLGFDTGPGNCLMDITCKQHFDKEYDKNGEIARTGSVNEELLQRWLNDPYFSIPAPKSTGREYFNATWLCEPNIPPADLLATLAMLTARTICDAIKENANPSTKIFVCGGGAYNSYLLECMSNIMEQEIGTTADLGIAPEWVEAGLFAWLAQQALENKSIDSSSITGATQSVILGGIYPANS